MGTILLVAIGVGFGYLIGVLFTRPGPVRYVRVSPNIPESSAQIGKCAAEAIELVREVAALGERLTLKNICINKLTCDYGGLRCWELQLEDGAKQDRLNEMIIAGQKFSKGPDVVRVFWDGMEYILTVEVSPRYPHALFVDRKKILTKKIGRDGDGIGFIETYLQEHFGTAQTQETPS